jgi:hypothetical protein
MAGAHLRRDAVLAQACDDALRQRDAASIHLYYTYVKAALPLRTILLRAQCRKV